MDNCLFCQIANHLAPAKIIYETAKLVAFDDLHKDAPEHVLIVPKQHLTSLNEVGPADQEILGDLLLAVALVAKKLQIDQTGYRCLINTGRHGGQIIPHLHLHLLGGRHLGPILQKDLPVEP